MNDVCNWCIRFLYKASDYLGMSYEEINGTPTDDEYENKTFGMMLDTELEWFWRYPPEAVVDETVEEWKIMFDSATLNTLGKWCRLRDLNSRPTDYKSVALPTELKRHKII